MQGGGDAGGDAAAERSSWGFRVLRLFRRLVLNRRARPGEDLSGILCRDVVQVEGEQRLQVQRGDAVDGERAGVDRLRQALRPGELDSLAQPGVVGQQRRHLRHLEAAEQEKKESGHAQRDEEQPDDGASDVAPVHAVVARDARVSIEIRLARLERCAREDCDVQEKTALRRAPPRLRRRRARVAPRRVGHATWRCVLAAERFSHVI